MGFALADRFGKEMEVIGTTRTEAPVCPWRQLVHDWRNPFYAMDGLKSDLFVHAAFKSLPYPVTPIQTQEILDWNETMARNAAEAALRLEVGKVILLSTGSVYGERDEIVTERTPLILREQASPYALSSRTVEEIFRFFLAGVPLIIVRLFYPYGPRVSHDRLVSRLATKIAKGEPIKLRPDDKNLGRPRINPVFIDDAAEAILKLAGAKSSGEGGVLTVNLGGPEILSIRELADKIAKQLGKKCRFEIDSNSPPAHDLFCSNQLLSALTGCAPAIKFDTGLQATLKNLNLSK